jgi:hypothetical protein
MLQNKPYRDELWRAFNPQKVPLTPIGSIEYERAACIDAFEAVPDACLVWCCHHEILLENLTEPFVSRIGYIDRNKPVNEQAVRFRNFRPVRNAPHALMVASAAHREARIAVENANRACTWASHQADPTDLSRAQGLFNSVSWDYNQAGQAQYDALQKWINRVASFNEDWPDNTWNGRDIF